ncbi:hypothetical protein [Jeongeupia chitinilytica]|uniref:Uncharacterized protein n=1 Tax=Jeongeupia chitinilytica TaxID=1041641 RepID=A0ABQ3H3V5_9NEIS|nr:hypothetical protein [Jeongeupia chitinilytica]GHD65739.1 hypothetical protein GCM10007350_26660 [Jeongeupia chitinilytica]
MTDWTIWQALDDWRSRRRELEPVFAQAGIAPELESQVNRILVDLKRQPPTPPLVSGDRQRDEEERSRYNAAFVRHYDESLFKAESLVRLPWVPEASPIGEAIVAEVARLRATLQSSPGEAPDFADLEALLGHYLRLDHPQLTISPELLAERRRQIADVAGWPLLVQRSTAQPFNDVVPPIGTEAFREAFYAQLDLYLATPWLHCKIVSQWYATLALDAVLMRKKREAGDDAFVAATFKHRWPSLSVLLPQLEMADQIWYLTLIIAAIVALFGEYWLVAVPLILWLNLSVGAHRRQRKRVEQRREELVARAQMLKKVRDRFAAGMSTPDRLAHQLRQLDPGDETFGASFYALLRLQSRER